MDLFSWKRPTSSASYTSRAWIYIILITWRSILCDIILSITLIRTSRLKYSYNHMHEKEKTEIHNHILGYSANVWPNNSCYFLWRLNNLNPVAKQYTECSWPQSHEITLMCRGRAGDQWIVWQLGALSLFFLPRTHIQSHGEWWRLVGLSQNKSLNHPCFTTKIDNYLFSSTRV